MEYNLTNEFQSLKADQGYYLITIGMYENEPTVFSKLPIVGWRITHNENSSNADPIAIGFSSDASYKELHGILHPDGKVYDYFDEYIGNVGQEYDEWVELSCKILAERILITRADELANSAWLEPF